MPAYLALVCGHGHAGALLGERQGLQPGAAAVGAREAAHECSPGRTLLTEPQIVWQAGRLAVVGPKARTSAKLDVARWKARRVQKHTDHSKD